MCIMGANEKLSRWETACKLFSPHLYLSCNTSLLAITFQTPLNVFTVETPWMPRLPGCIFFHFIAEKFMTIGNEFIFTGRENEWFLKKNFILVILPANQTSRGNGLYTTVDVYQQQECLCLAGNVFVLLWVIIISCSWMFWAEHLDE